MKKLLYCLIFTSLMILLAVVPASAMNYHHADIYTFEDLKSEIDALNEEGITDTLIVFDIHKDITFTDTIDIDCKDIEIDFKNCSDKNEVKFNIDGHLAFDINTYNPDVKLYFDDVAFYAREDNVLVSESAVEVSKYSDGCLIDGAKFTNLTNYHSNGGCIYVNAENCTIQNCTFNDCIAEYGGCIYINNDIVNVNYCTFTKCGAREYGAGAYVASGCSGIKFDGCTFTKSYCMYNNVGICVYGSGEDNVTIINCTSDNGWQSYYYCKETNTLGSLLSTGNIWIITTIVALACIVIVFIKRKNKANAA